MIDTDSIIEHGPYITITITADGDTKTMRESDLAYYLDPDHREEIHHRLAPCTMREYYSAYAAQWPDELEGAVEMTPEDAP